MRVEQQKAYIIHTRAFRDTSLLIDCYTQKHGRVSLIAKGARTSRNKNRSLLQPFRLLSISWQGRGNLKTLIDIESIGTVLTPQGYYLYSGLYINELFLYLLPEEDASDYLFERYHALLIQLNQQDPLEPTLRQFELNLLDELGYSIDFFNDAHTAEPINYNKEYVYFVGHGFVDAEISSSNGAIHFTGSVLMQIAEGRFSDPLVLNQAKSITRLSIDTLLEGQLLKSRDFFKQIMAQTTNNKEKSDGL